LSLSSNSLHSSQPLLSPKPTESTASRILGDAASCSTARVVLQLLATVALLCGFVLDQLLGEVMKDMCQVSPKARIDLTRVTTTGVTEAARGRLPRKRRLATHSAVPASEEIGACTAGER
jgi:hypothetical protein